MPGTVVYVLVLLPQIRHLFTASCDLFELFEGTQEKRTMWGHVTFSQTNCSSKICETQEQYTMVRFLFKPNGNCSLLITMIVQGSAVILSPPK